MRLIPPFQLWKLFGFVRILTNHLCVQQNLMSYRHWQKAFFYKTIRSLLGHFAGDAINYLEFKLLVFEGNLTFFNPDDQVRSKQYFELQGQVSKQEVADSLILLGVRTIHSRPQYIVKLKKSKEEMKHIGDKCFIFWKERMNEKCGYVHQWFERLCLERDIKRVQSLRFNNCIERILKGTEHEKCSQKISLSFQKTKKNEIQFSVFMNTILVSTKKSISDYIQAIKSTPQINNKKSKTHKLSMSRDIFEQCLSDKEISTIGSTHKRGWSVRSTSIKKSPTNLFLENQYKTKSKNIRVLFFS